MASLSTRLAELSRERNELLKEVTELQARCAASAARLDCAQGGAAAARPSGGNVTAAPSDSASKGHGADQGSAADDAALKLLNEVR
jgi:hypothetical protein